MQRLLPFGLLVATLALALGCGSRERAASSAETPPPFAVRDDSTGLVFTFGDATGFRTVERIADVPEASRAQVRVEPLAGERSLDASRVWVADLRSRGADGTYAVRVLERDAFEQAVRPAPAPPPEPAAVPATGEIVLYGTSWCGACRTAREYFRGRGIAFVDKDIERDPAAREEMMRKARAQGVPTGGVPVIDVRGRMLPGFDRALIDRLLAGG